MALQEIITELKKTESKAENSIVVAQQAAKTTIENAHAKVRELRQAQELTLDKERESKLKVQEKKVATQVDEIKKETNKSLVDLERSATKKKAQIVKEISQIIQ